MANIALIFLIGMSNVESRKRFSVNKAGHVKLTCSYFLSTISHMKAKSMLVLLNTLPPASGILWLTHRRHSISSC